MSEVLGRHVLVWGLHPQVKQPYRTLMHKNQLAPTLEDQQSSHDRAPQDKGTLCIFPKITGAAKQCLRTTRDCPQLDFVLEEQPLSCTLVSAGKIPPGYIIGLSPELHQRKWPCYQSPGMLISAARTCLIFTAPRAGALSSPTLYPIPERERPIG